MDQNSVPGPLFVGGGTGHTWRPTLTLAFRREGSVLLLMTCGKFTSGVPYAVVLPMNFCL